MDYLKKYEDAHNKAYDKMTPDEKKIFEDNFEKFEEEEEEKIKSMSDDELGKLIGAKVTPALRKAIETACVFYRFIDDLVEYAQDLPEED